MLDQVGIERCHLLGHSLGCLMAARFAATRPGRVLSLTLCSIAGGHAALPAEERQKLLDQRIGDVAALGPLEMAKKRAPRLLGPKAPADALGRLIDTMGSVRPRGYAQAARMLSTGDIKADIARLSPALRGQVIYGDADVITPPARIEDIAKAWPGAAVHIIPGAGHALYLEQPEAFNALLSRFLSKSMDK
jgi:pimeloyl-ACP methyl ester carboxylesterase